MHFLIILPLLLIVTLAVLQFALMAVVEGGVNAASRAGADVAARGGGLQEVAAAVESVLAMHHIELVDSAQTGDSTGNLLVMLEVAERPGIGLAGNQEITTQPEGPALVDGEIRVTVCVQLTGGVRDPIPNWLSFAGYSLRGYQVRSSSLAVRETAHPNVTISRSTTSSATSAG